MSTTRKIVCRCGYRTEESKAFVNHMFETKHGISDDFPDTPEMRTELEAALMQAQYYPESGTKVEEPMERELFYDDDDGPKN